MRKIALSLVVLICFVAVKAKNKINSTDKKMPNIVIIYGDDVGFGDVGVYGSKLIQTPNIDQLAKEGLQFTDGHCTAATCTPSRFALLTGVYGFRHDVNILPPNAPLSIPTDIMTLPKMLKKAGYTTGIVGKWHLGIGEKDSAPDWNRDVKPGPLEVGFDYSFLLPSTNDRVPCVYLEGHRVANLKKSDPLYVGKKPEVAKRSSSTQYPDGKENRAAMTYYESTQGHNNSVINGIGRIGYMAGGESALWNDETMADVFVEKAKKYIKKHKDEPFFLYFASQDIHVPRTPHPRFQGKTDLGYRGDAMVQFDWTTGQIMETLEKLGLKDNTIVIFSSDNGPVYDDGYDDGTTVFLSNEEVDNGHDASGIHSGGKYKIQEGGTRVPFIIRWPNTIKPGQSKALVNQVDFLASFASLLNVELDVDDAIDSRNTLEAFLGKTEIGLPSMIEESPRNKALRRGEWKYVPGKSNKNNGKISAQLYKLNNDPAEKNNLINDYPDIAKSMDEELKRLINSQSIRKGE